MPLLADGDPLFPPRWSDLGEIGLWAAPTAIIVLSWWFWRYHGDWLARRIARAVMWWRGDKADGGPGPAR